MNREDLKELVKQHFNLIESSTEEVFADATLEDGTVVTNDKAGALAMGDKIFVKVDGELKAAPEGDHVTESGIVLTLDAESVVVGLKKPDEAGEGSADLAEDAPEEVEAKVEEEMAEHAEEDESKMEEDKEEEMEEEAAPKLEEIIEVIGEVVEEKLGELKDKMKVVEEKMKDMEEKMSAFSSEPADEATVPTAKFSAQNSVVNEKRYNRMLTHLTK